MDIASGKVAGSKAKSGEVILAECQTKGRGRRGRSWKQSERPGLNLAFTLVLRMDRHEDLFKLNFATPTAVALTCKQEDQGTTDSYNPRNL
jgi:biotin-(acetyl-CoA carboxylase) ligase